jgi:endonuclease/exonuclease/phosphatase family metal-dependent hydrolase
VATATGIALLRWEGPTGDPRMPGWRANVGEPVALDHHPEHAASDDANALTLLSWNLWVGRGRLLEMVERIRSGALARLGAAPEAPLVVLLQEAYRSDESIPARTNGWTPLELAARSRPQEDVVDAARQLGLSLCYVASMRNRGERSDRGNAILASLPLTDPTAIELPFMLQRRVALSASITLAGRRVRLVSGHLDPRGPPGHKWLGAAGRGKQTAHLLSAIDEDVVLLGADLNLARGRAERSWRLLREAGFTFGVPPTLPAWRHTYHALPRLVLDYVLIRDRAGAVRHATIERLDQDPHDRGPTVFGSDHHPLLARIELTPPDAGDGS